MRRSGLEKRRFYWIRLEEISVLRALSVYLNGPKFPHAPNYRGVPKCGIATFVTTGAIVPSRHRSTIESIRVASLLLGFPQVHTGLLPKTPITTPNAAPSRGRAFVRAIGK